MQRVDKVVLMVIWLILNFNEKSTKIELRFKGSLAQALSRFIHHGTSNE